MTTDFAELQYAAGGAAVIAELADEARARDLLTIGYRLIRPDKVRRAAFADVISNVSDGTSFPVMSGTPRTAPIVV